jgi:hypothetical protein
MRAFGWLSVAAFCLCAHRTYAQNYIQQENSKPGTSEWQLASPSYASGAIEGYASLTSVNRGGQIQLFVNTSDPRYTIDLFRMGYYGGLGARRMMRSITMTGRTQPIPTPDPITGLIECNWTNPYTLTIPNSADPTDWMSGIYLAKLTAGVSGKQSYIVFAVRDDARAADLLMLQTVNTYQAYNPWGGKSLYGTVQNRSDTVNAAIKVSFNRPYYGGESNGGGDFFWWEYPQIQWQEGEGYEVKYATNVDLDATPTLLNSVHGAIIFGHDEYWTWKMRTNAEQARDAGKSWGIFAGNVAFWQVRYENSVVNGQPARTMVGYKTRWWQDPILPAYLKTNEFRYAPVNRPEQSFVGVGWITVARPAFVVEDASNWVFTGTGLQNGDRITNADGSPFMGYEVDVMGSSSPSNIQRIAHSPLNAERGDYYADTTVYRAPSGATVFASGSVGWPQSIPPIQQITRNVFARLIDDAFEDTTPVRPTLPSPFQARDIGDVGRPGFVSRFDPATNTFVLNGAGLDRYRTDDALYLVYLPLSGDGQITARVVGLQLLWDARAGVTIRESLDPDAKYVSVSARPTGYVRTPYAPPEGVELLTRDTSGAGSNLVSYFDHSSPNWVRLERNGDIFTAAVSADGITWSPLGTATVPMQRDVYMGLSVLSASHAEWATATFDNVEVVGVNEPLDRSDWTAAATEDSGYDPPDHAIDGDINTRFSTGEAQHDNQGFIVSWPSDRPISRIRMEVGPSVYDWPRTCGIWVKDSVGSVTFVPCAADADGNVDVTFPTIPANTIEVWQWGTSDWWWSIAEFNVFH